MQTAQAVGAGSPAPDLPHVVVASAYGCEAIVAYDHHFRATSSILPYRSPEDFAQQ